MELTTMQMYLLVKLDDLRSFFIALIILSIVVFFSGIIMRSDADIYSEEIRRRMLKKSIKILNWSVVAFLSAVIPLTLLPSTKQMAAIMIVPKIANSEKVQTIGNKVYDLAIEWMNELKPIKKGSAE